MRVTFLASNDTHVTMFAPVASTIERFDAVPRFVSLDRYYGQGATAAASRIGVSCVELDGGSAAVGRFYRRLAPAIWADVLRSLVHIDRYLQDAKPDVLVVGNDFGLIEKAFLHRAAPSVRRRVLVQDGKLSPSRPAPASPTERFTSLAKAGLSPLLRAAGLGYLARSEYGTAEVDAVCASGDSGASILRSRAQKALVVVTGQPRYDRLAALLGQRAPRSDIVGLFTTADLDARADRAQGAMAAALAEPLATRGLRLVVKPHPRESPTRYATLLGGESHVWLSGAAELLRRSRLAIIGVSTVIEEAGILGCPVVVPGALVHGRRNERFLPPDPPYPRFDSAEEGLRLVQRCLADGRHLRQLADDQRVHVLAEVAFSPDKPAAEAVAHVILGDVPR